MRKGLIILLPLIAALTSIRAQETVFEEARTVYKREQTYGFILHTTGWGINYKYGQYTSGFTRRTFEAEVVGYKHPKEIKTFSSLFNDSNGYVFGKRNSIFIFRGSYGVHHTFISKQSVRGIAISYVLNGGFSFAYAKPIYLEVVNEGQVFPEINRYDPDRHSQGDIIGKGPALRGLFGGKFYPGLMVKAGLNFESSRQASKINSLEVGVIVDAYLQDIPILANELNNKLLYNLYLTIAFGSKKTE